MDKYWRLIPKKATQITQPTSQEFDQKQAFTIIQLFSEVKYKENRKRITHLNVESFTMVARDTHNPTDFQERS